VSEANTSALCESCPSRCCKHFAVWVKPNDEMLGLIEAHYGREDLKRIKVHVYHRCQHLTDDDLCDVYGTDEQPEFCREFLCGPAKNGVMELGVLDIHGESVEHPMHEFLDNDV